MKHIFFIFFYYVFLLCNAQLIEEYKDCVKEGYTSGNYTLSAHYLDKIIEIDSLDAALYFDRAMLKKGFKDVDGAIGDFTKAIAIDSTGVDSYFERGMLYNKHEKFSLAIIDLNKTIELESKNADAYYQRGLAYSKLRLHKKAIADFTIAINKREHPEAHLERARAILQFKKDGVSLKKALTDYDAAYSQNNENPLFYKERGDLYVLLKNKTKACEDYTLYLKYCENNCNAYTARDFCK